VVYACVYVCMLNTFAYQYLLVKLLHRFYLLRTIERFPFLFLFVLGIKGGNAKIRWDYLGKLGRLFCLIIMA
jgi:hypothetical protein